MLQWWLATRKRNTWNYLNPLQYSIDCNVNIETAISLFFVCSFHEDVKTFNVRTISRCPNCETVVAKERDSIVLVNLPQFCDECGVQLDGKFLKDDSEIFFSLIVDPIPPTPAPRAPLGVESIEAEPLTFSRVTSEGSADVKGIIARMSML